MIPRAYIARITPKLRPQRLSLSLSRLNSRHGHCRTLFLDQVDDAIIDRLHPGQPKSTPATSKPVPASDVKPAQVSTPTQLVPPPTTTDVPLSTTKDINPSDKPTSITPPGHEEMNRTRTSRLGVATYGPLTNRPLDHKSFYDTYDALVNMGFSDIRIVVEVMGAHYCYIVYVRAMTHRFNHRNPPIIICVTEHPARLSINNFFHQAQQLICREALVESISEVVPTCHSETGEFEQLKSKGWKQRDLNKQPEYTRDRKGRRADDSGKFGLVGPISQAAISLIRKDQ
ncbi:hypothetical protein L198_04116 [Cryptococcus wingfieldii CBS 7118]|uniref:Uncharacterized protein n=1 Tax=Cryptococcus wingfieldii CBS 7118 TaxID=1295528 RepID=A0A1E3J6D4_9TREE|nr:hypothetical protein L198_04116 [Cryptococcus wingfieldii CBS 7118]ODN96402.1 hypothetical protein L198_04116 [Cryptococcus wingfieldii CBS 7118]